MHRVMMCHTCYLSICFSNSRHEAGLTSFGPKLGEEDSLTENIKLNAVGKVIEAEEQAFPSEHLGSLRKEIHK
jgi:hypothetical protein